MERGQPVNQEKNVILLRKNTSNSTFFPDHRISVPMQ